MELKQTLPMASSMSAPGCGSREVGSMLGRASDREEFTRPGKDRVRKEGVIWYGRA